MPEELWLMNQKYIIIIIKTNTCQEGEAVEGAWAVGTAPLCSIPRVLKNDT